MGRDDDHKSGSITSSYRFNYHTRGSPSVGAPYRYESAPPPGARTQSLGSVKQEDEPPPAQRDWGRTRTTDSCVTHPPNKRIHWKQTQRSLKIAEGEGPYDEFRRRRAYLQYLNGESYPKWYSGIVSGYPPVGNAARLPESLLPTRVGAMYPPPLTWGPMYPPPQLPPPGAGVHPYVAAKTDNSGGKIKIDYTYSFKRRQPPSSQNVIIERTSPYESESDEDVEIVRSTV